MRILGLDVGERRIGIAVSDALGLTAQPVTTLHRKNLKDDLEAIRALVQQYEAQEIVVGMPLHLSGKAGEKVREVFEFVHRLQGKVRIPIKTQDERLTTVQAEGALREGGVAPARRKEMIDQVAAQLILQAYLDRRRK